METNRTYARSLARAFAGAILFALPLLMTMEMWWFGFYISRPRLALFVLLTLPILVGVSHYAGFRQTFRWRDTTMDALSAYAVGCVAAAAALALFGVIAAGMPAREVVGKVAVQTVPASIGALLARQQLGGGGAADGGGRPGRSLTYARELFLMAVGGLFFAFNVAPTQEMVLLAYKMTSWHALALALSSLALLHALVYTVGFAGQEDPGRDASFASVFARFTVVGYVLALAVSAYVLWTFGRTDGTSATQVVMSTIVLGFPAALGAALARLIV